MASPVWQSVGSHRYYVQDDLLFIEYHGEATLNDCQVLFEETAQIADRHGYFLTLFDAGGMSGITAEARRRAGAWLRAHRVDRAVAVVGAGVTMRTIVALLQNAAQLFGRPAPPTFFAATIEAAMDWLNGERQRFLVKRGGHPPAS